jgi:hypothetical protein
MSTAVVFVVLAGAGSVEWIDFEPYNHLFDDGDWPDHEFGLEAQGHTSDVAKPLYIRLYNKTLAAEVSGTEFTIAATTKTRGRSSNFALDSGSNEYTVQFGGEAGATYTLYRADLRGIPL